MKKIFAVAASVMLTLPAFTQSLQGKLDSSFLPRLDYHYQDEYTSDVSSDEGAWNKAPAGLNTAFGSTDQLYFRKDVPTFSLANEYKATAWRGERVNMQLLVWSTDTLEQVRFKLKSLQDESGNNIDPSHASFYLVRYVLSNYPYGARNAVCGTSPYSDGYLMPDRFETLDRFDLPGKTTRPVWFSLQVPADAKPGNYKGVIEAKSLEHTKTLEINVRVQNKTLPPPSEWKYLLDLWQNPWAVAWYNDVEPWSDQHKALLKQHLKLYADAGGKYITTYAVHSPWADNSFMIEGGMIEWLKQKDGKWKFDYTIFDEYVQLCIDAGIKHAITIYTPVPWGERFRYKDEATGNYVYAQWKPETQSFRDNFGAFLTDLKKHLENKGWMKITYLGINENEMKQTLAAINVIKQHSKDWRITYAGDWHNELDTLLNDYSYLYGKEPNAEQLKKRAGRGATSTYYVCCNPPYPNNFVFSPPIEGRWLSWYTAASGYDGFLRWAYDAWPEDPERDARHGSWAAGDCYLVYPGGKSCIRFEKLREGIVDFEKIRILKTEAEVSKDKKTQDVWKQLVKHLEAFRNEKEFNQEKLTADVEKGKRLLGELTDRLHDK